MSDRRHDSDVSSFLCLFFSSVLAPFNPKNKDRRLHRHPAFFGDIQECMEDCCEVRSIPHNLTSCVRRLIRQKYCPEPKNDEEKVLQKEEDEKYIRGRIQYAPGSSFLLADIQPRIGSSKKIPVAKASQGASIPLTMASGLNRHTSEKRRNSARPSFPSIALPYSI